MGSSWSTTEEALAEAWASIDGKLAEFQYGKEHRDTLRAGQEGYYEGYLADARELIRRLETRGYLVLRKSGSSSVLNFPSPRDR